MLAHVYYCLAYEWSFHSYVLHTYMHAYVYLYTRTPAHTHTKHTSIIKQSYSIQTQITTKDSLKTIISVVPAHLVDFIVPAFKIIKDSLKTIISVVPVHLVGFIVPALKIRKDSLKTITSVVHVVRFPFTYMKNMYPLRDREFEFLPNLWMGFRPLVTFVVVEIKLA
jgi:hypothetical protein